MIFFDYVRHVSSHLPTWDKWAIPSSLLAAGVVSTAQTVGSVIIVLLTIATMIPRMMIAWNEWRRDREKSDSDQDRRERE